MWFRKGSDEITEGPAPDLFLDLINELDQDVLLLSGGDTPIITSSGVENLNILRDGKFLSPEILAMFVRCDEQEIRTLENLRSPADQLVRAQESSLLK